MCKAFIPCFDLRTTLQTCTAIYVRFILWGADGAVCVAFSWYLQNGPVSAFQVWFLFFFFKINLHYKTHLYIYLMLKPEDFLACMYMECFGGLCGEGLRCTSGLRNGARPGVGASLCTLCWLGIEGFRLEGCHPGMFTTAKLAFRRTNALKCSTAAGAEVGLGFPAGYLNHSIYHDELWEVCKGGKHLKWHHRLWDCNSDILEEPVRFLMLLFSSRWHKLQVHKAFALGKGLTSAISLQHIAVLFVYFKMQWKMFLSAINHAHLEK